MDASRGPAAHPAPSDATCLPVVGMVGAGQLARMTHQAAIGPGLSLRVLAERATDSAALVAPDVKLGDYRSLADLLAFAAGCDVVTFDHEHVSADHVRTLAAVGTVVRPGPEALRYAQDKLAMRARLRELGLPVPAWRAVADPGDVKSHAARHGWPVVAKAVRGGYDGRGVWLVEDQAAAGRLLAEVDVPLYAEERVPLERELAAVVARTPSGETRAWPVVETVQRGGICVEVLVPAPDIDPRQAATAQEIALVIAAELAVVGVLAVELFARADGALVVNELAMRPHNSAHWTIEGARTSQFEQHLRAVLDWPLGDPTPTAPATATANVIGGPDPGLARRLPAVLAADPGAHVHLYGKAPRPGRKLGHVTVVGDDPVEVRRRAARAAALLRGDAP